ncbi:reverse transcriptase domain-containing protein [Tanacetum coccineum]|uniref:Reverse transcriptase domain-containing protein n=1 Tax=Tanacetum coccineum TaxID=301880 RepID=A0ABQ5I3A1_9ASTR
MFDGELGGVLNSDMPLTQEVNHLRLDSLTKLPSEILATELQLQLPPCPRTVAPSKKENLDRYCDYHGNDCYHLKRQLKAALESEKLNHLVKDVRQRGNNRGRQPGNNNGRGKVINMIQEGGECQKRKSWRSQAEEWINIPITFPPVPTDDVSDDPLIIEAEVEGYLVRRMFVDQGAAVQVMFEYCFDNLSPAIKARLTPTQTELVSFFGKQLIPIGKVELEVKFGGGGLFRKTMLKFTVVRASSLYNIILGHMGMRELRAVSSTVHAMVKLPTPRGIATLVARTTPVYKCRWSEKKMVKHDERIEVRELEGLEESEEEKVLVNPAFPEQTVMIGTQFSAECRERLISLLKNNMDVFAWQTSDMVGVPRRVIKHAPNVNIFVPPVAQKRRVVGTEKRRAVTKEVEEWVKAGIGYHQIQMSEDDEEKTAFYTDQGTYCYTKMPFGLKNAGVTYQRLVDLDFQTQLGRNLEACVDEVVIKISGVLVADRKEKQTPIRYVSQTLHEAERNYAPLEKLALCLLHLSRRLRRYFEAHPIRVITDQPIKQILNKSEVSRKLSKYAIELGAYNIMYVPRNAIKGQVLAYFINEIPVGTKHLEICSLTNKESSKEWTLYTDGVSSPKGVEAGLILIDPSGTEYTYGIRLTFPSTNSEAEYEALLAGLWITRKMKVQALKVKVDSKLVACQMNAEFVESSKGMAKYLAKAKEHAALFKKFSIRNIPRNQNQKADVLSKLASVAFNHLIKGVLVEVLNAKSMDAQEVNTIVEEEDN